MRRTDTQNLLPDMAIRVVETFINDKGGGGIVFVYHNHHGHSGCVYKKLTTRTECVIADAVALGLQIRVQSRWSPYTLIVNLTQPDSLDKVWSFLDGIEPRIMP